MIPLTLMGIRRNMIPRTTTLTAPVGLRCPDEQTGSVLTSLALCQWWRKWEVDSPGSVRCRQPTESVECENCSPSLEPVHAISVCSAWLMSISHALTDLSGRSDSIAGEAAPDSLSTTTKGPIAKKIPKHSSGRWHQWCLNFRCKTRTREFPLPVSFFSRYGVPIHPSVITTAENIKTDL